MPTVVLDLTLDLTLSLEIKSAVLRIRDRKIVGASVAHFEGKGKLALGKAVLLERSISKFEVPPVTFQEEIVIS